MKDINAAARVGAVSQYGRLRSPVQRIRRKETVISWVAEGRIETSLAHETYAVIRELRPAPNAHFLRETRILREGKTMKYGTIFPVCAALFAAAIYAGSGTVASADDDPNRLRTIQSILKNEGFLYGDVNGVRDAETLAAIKRFQIRNGLKITGDLDPETRAALLNRSQGFPAKRETVADSATTERPPRAKIRVAAKKLRVETWRESAKPMSEQTVRAFLEDYLHAAEQDSTDAEVDFYWNVVSYFENGRFVRRFSPREQSRFRGWPYRRFVLQGEPSVAAMSDEEAVIKFRVFYRVSDGRNAGEGYADSAIRVRNTTDGLKITEIWEQRI